LFADAAQQDRAVDLDHVRGLVLDPRLQLLVVAVVDRIADADVGFAGERPKVRRALRAGKLVVEAEDHQLRPRDAESVARVLEHRYADRGDDRQPRQYQPTSATHPCIPTSMLAKSNILYLLFATSPAYTCVAPCMFERNTTHLLSGGMVTFGSSR